MGLHELGLRFPPSPLWSEEGRAKRQAEQERRLAPNGRTTCPRCGGLNMRDIPHCRQDGWPGRCEAQRDG